VVGDNRSEHVETVRLIVETGFGLSVLVICALKGKWGFVILGFALPILWIIGAVKLAKPRSWWAHHYYGDVVMSESEQHFVLSKRERPPAASG
jgi:hypothetical protein